MKGHKGKHLYDAFPTQKEVREYVNLEGVSNRKLEKLCIGKLHNLYSSQSNVKFFPMPQQIM
jgi:hypothetical protein